MSHIHLTTTQLAGIYIIVTAAVCHAGGVIAVWISRAVIAITAHVRRA